jgi:hypothetical protein
MGHILRIYGFLGGKSTPSQYLLYKNYLRLFILVLPLTSKERKK